MAKIEKNQGQPGCQHSYASGGKKVIQICNRFCTKCGHRELFCDNEDVPQELLSKIYKEA